MVTRLSGFSNTGIDIDDTVRKLMQAARMPLDKLNKQKQTIEWQRDDYRSINSKIMDFRNLAFNMKLQASYQTKQSVSANDSAVSASATSTAPEGIYSIKVNQLATSASMNSGKLNTSSLNPPGATATLGSLASGAFTTETSLIVSGEKGATTISVKPGDSIEGFVSAVNSKSNITGVTVSYDSNIDKLYFVSSTTGSKAKVDLKMEDPQLAVALGLQGSSTPSAGETFTGSAPFASGSSTLIDSTITSTQKINIKYAGKSVDFDVNSTTTIGKLMDAINSSDIGKSGVSAYLNSNKELVFFNPNTGIDDLEISDAAANTKDISTKLGFGTMPTPSLPTSHVQYKVQGKPALIEFNGDPDVIEYDTNTFSINGMNFTAKQEGGPAVNITVTRDVDSVYNSIKTFVDKYNELVDIVNKKTSEKKYRDFQPLTDEEREALDEDQIKKWEEKAKSGMLRSDPILTRGLNNFRSAFSNIVDGLPMGNARSLSEIGISTTLVVGSTVSGSFSENGKIYIDDTKLKKAIAENPDEVMALFNSDDGIKDSDKGDGLAIRLYDKANALMNQITSKAGATTSVESNYLLGKNTIALNKRIDDMGRKLEALEIRYYKQFTAMEKFINQLSAQSASLAQSFGQ